MLIWTYWPGPEGGAERQSRALVQEFARRGMLCTVLTSLSGHDIRGVIKDGSVTVRRFGLLCPSAAALRKQFFRIASLAGGVREERLRAMAFWALLPFVWLSRLSFLLGLAAYAMRTSAPCDVLHVHESGWLAGVGIVLGRRWRIPVICKEATTPALGPIGYDTPFRRTWARYRRSADAWVAPTANARDELRALGLPPDRIHLVPNGVVVPLEMADPTRSNGVLYVGNLTQGATWKGFDVLFDAWVRVAQAYPDARLTVVGAGDPKPWIRDLRRGGVESSVLFTGHRDDPAALYRSAGIFVLPSRIEGLSNALLEAQSWGLACVVSDIPGNRAVVEHGRNGLTVPVGDANALSEAIVSLLTDPEMRKNLGAEARRKAAVEFSFENTVTRLLGIYQQAGKF